MCRIEFEPHLLNRMHNIYIDSLLKTQRGSHTMATNSHCENCLNYRRVYRIVVAVIFNDLFAKFDMACVRTIESICIAVYVVVWTHDGDYYYASSGCSFCCNVYSVLFSILQSHCANTSVHTETEIWSGRHTHPRFFFLQIYVCLWSIRNVHTPIFNSSMTYVEFKFAHIDKYSWLKLSVRSIDALVRNKSAIDINSSQKRTTTGYQLDAYFRNNNNQSVSQIHSNSGSLVA